MLFVVQRLPLWVTFSRLSAAHSGPISVRLSPTEVTKSKLLAIRENDKEVRRFISTDGL